MSPGPPRPMKHDGTWRLILETTVHTVLLPGTVIVVLPWLIVSSGLEVYVLPLGSLRVLGVMLIAIGLGLGTWCTWEFISSGKGTPNPLDPPKLVVARGAYRVVRNPMYVSVLAILLGEATILCSTALLLYAGGVFLLFHSFVVWYEEPTLGRMFGEAYERYRAQVPRWLPGRPRRAP